MADRVLRGSRLGAVSYETDRNHDLAPRQLAKYRTENKVNDVALIRVEQLYPFPYNTLATILGPYKNAEFVWCQEEPENMGAWHFVDRKLEKVLAGLDRKDLVLAAVGEPPAVIDRRVVPGADRAAVFEQMRRIVDEGAREPSGERG